LRLGLYHKLLQQHDILCLTPADNELQDLEAVIRQVIAGQAGRREQAILQRLVARLHAQGAEAILLGCTELPLAIGDTNRYPLPVIDCLKLYAAVTMHDYYLYNGAQDE
jgi:aspartate racemase